MRNDVASKIADENREDKMSHRSFRNVESIGGYVVMAAIHIPACDDRGQEWVVVNIWMKTSRLHHHGALVGIYSNAAAIMTKIPALPAYMPFRLEAAPI